MAKRKTRAAPRRRLSSAPRRRASHKKSDAMYIPAAAATAGLIYANLPVIRNVVGNPSIDGVKSAAMQAVQVDQLKKTAAYTIGAGVAGEAIKKFAPSIVKKPLGKVAKKMPRVF